MKKNKKIPIEKNESFQSLSKISQNRVKKLTKFQQKEFLNLTAKFNLTLKEYKEFKDQQKRTRKKFYNITYKNKSTSRKTLRNPKISTSSGRITDRESFNEQKKIMRNYNKKDYSMKENQVIRNRFYTNLKEYFTDDPKRTKRIIDKFKSMSDKEFYEFTQNNSDFKPVIYDSDQDYATLINEQYETTESRLNLPEWVVETDQ